MNKPLKAILLSLLIFPGAGHLFLKKYSYAFIYIFCTLISLSLLLRDTMSNVQTVLDKVSRGEVVADLSDIIELMSSQSGNAISTVNPVLVFLLITWLLSGIDAYRLGMNMKYNGGA